MGDKTKALFIWEVREELKHYLINKLKDYPEIDLIFPNPATRENFLKLVSDVEILVGWRPTKPLLEKAENLKLVINPGAGVNRLIELFNEINSSRDEPIILCNGHGNSYFTAQHAVSLLLAVTNKISPHHNWMKAGKWRRGDKFAKSIPLRNKTVGLLGYGAVNKKVHQFLSGFTLKFKALKTSWNDIKDKKIPTIQHKYTPNELDNFLDGTDILILALPFTTQTENMITKHELDLLNQNAIVINVARGAIIDQKDFFETLQNKELGGAGIDVWYNYQPEPNEDGKKFPFDLPFHQLDNVVLSPHRGASPMDDLLRWDEVVTNIINIHTQNNNLINVVNLEKGY